MAPMSGPSSNHITPRPAARRRLRLAVGLGVVLAGSSLTVAIMAMRSHAASGSSATSPPAGPAATSPRKAVALGYVDVEDGIAHIYPVRPGRVKAVDAREGVAVAKDAPLLQLDDTEAQYKVKEAQSDLAAAKVRKQQAEALANHQRRQVDAQRQAVAVAQADVDMAKVQRDKVLRRRENDTATKEDAQAAELAVTKAERVVKAEQEKLAALEAQKPELAVKLAEELVAGKQAQLDQAEEARRQFVVRAPFMGMPLRVLVNVGDALGPNPQQPAIYFCPKADRIVRAEVEQEFALLVHTDQPVQIEDDATGTGAWTGKVKRLSDWYSQRRSILLEPLHFNDVRTLEAIVTLDPNQPPLRIGQRVRVLLQ